MKLKEIPDNVVVHTPTEAEAKELLVILRENGYKWGALFGKTIKNTHWHHNKENTTYKIDGDDKRVALIKEVVMFDLLSLAEFKERYCEEDKPQPRFKSDYNVGDIVVVTGSLCVNKGNKITLLRHYDAPREANDYNKVWVGQNATGNTFAIAEKDFEPYTEPETKPTAKETKESEETFASEELNLCELLKGHEGEEFYSPCYGSVAIEVFYCNPARIIVKADKRHTLAAQGTHYSKRDGQCMLFPSRALYEQYPLDPYTAWMKWQEEQTIYHIRIEFQSYDERGEMKRSNMGTLHFDDLKFRIPADRDKCIEEIKAIIKKYSKK